MTKGPARVGVSLGVCLFAAARVAPVAAQPPDQHAPAEAASLLEALGVLAEASPAPAEPSGRSAPAATPQEAARVYPADSWYALLDPPAAAEFRAVFDAHRRWNFLARPYR